mmetsp:Transcript_9228/g.23385  ORF Transcript_9228/g.23385 Transcript_9228/m.23385 type:complete len:226 (-) Transcript_9228:1868-2545(-)
MPCSSSSPSWSRLWLLCWTALVPGDEYTARNSRTASAPPLATVWGGNRRGLPERVRLVSLVRSATSRGRTVKPLSSRCISRSHVCRPFRLLGRAVRLFCCSSSTDKREQQPKLGGRPVMLLPTAARCSKDVRLPMPWGRQNSLLWFSLRVTRLVSSLNLAGSTSRLLCDTSRYLRLRKLPKLLGRSSSLLLLRSRVCRPGTGLKTGAGRETKRLCDSSSEIMEGV